MLQSIAKVNIFCRAASIILLLGVMGSCSYTRYVPEGRQLLTENEVVINERVVNNEKITNIIKQRPNKSIIGVRPYLILYNWGDPEAKKGIKHWFVEIGEPPVIVDSNLVSKSAYQIGLYLFGKGYFNNSYSYDVHMKKSKFFNPFTWAKNPKKAMVTYTFSTGPRYYLRRYTQTINSETIENLYEAFKDRSFIRSGMPYDVDSLEAERTRLAKLFRDHGYYAFPQSLIRFEADTLIEGEQVDLKLIISDLPIQQGDSVIFVPHKPSILKNVYVAVSQNPYRDTIITNDTISFRGYTFLNASRLQFRPFLIDRSLSFEKGQLYSEQKVTQSYLTLSNTRIFKTSDITFRLQSENDSVRYLNAWVRLSPFDKRAITTELEATNTSGNYGIGAGISWLNRNLFHGGEIFEMKLKGAIEAQVVSESSEFFNTNEIGAEISLKIPRFLLAGNFNYKIPKRMEPKTRTYMSITRQNRVEFTRVLFKTGIDYSWRESMTKSHTIAPLELTFVRVPQLDTSYYESLEFNNGFRDNFISTTRYTFIYNNQFKNLTHTDFFRGNFELGGNLLSLMDQAFGFNQSQDELNQGLIFGVPYTQYFKVDLDFRHSFNLPGDNVVVTRVFTGISYGYGNTPYAPPFEKQFFVGGSNDIRAWGAYKLGPGITPPIDGISTGTFKIMVNSEHRFPLLGNLEGALFIDAGNVWFLKKDLGYLTSGDLGGLTLKQVEEYTTFNFSTFFKQIAVGPGIGLRYDFSFFVFRLDTGFKLYNPQNILIDGVSPWINVPGLKFKDLSFNFALGYPF
ncbi:MAG: BamA/TamA family outer membrane protein [Bacteroidota bacterium]|nr:BamA/TamA family outer membrane protein [Bacteroidota bacterium]